MFLILRFWCALQFFTKMTCNTIATPFRNDARTASRKSTSLFCIWFADFAVNQSNQAASLFVFFLYVLALWESRIILPQSALDHLARLNISWPMLFEVGCCKFGIRQLSEKSAFIFRFALGQQSFQPHLFGADDKSCYIKINAWRCTGIHRKETQHGFSDPTWIFIVHDPLLLIFNSCNQDQLGRFFVPLPTCMMHSGCSAISYYH